MKGWKVAAAISVLALSVGGVSLAAPGKAKSAGADPAKAARMKEMQRQTEAAMTQLKMTEDQKKRARKLFAATLPKLEKIQASSGTPQQKQQQVMPLIQKLRTDMEKILTPEQIKQARALDAERMKRFQGAQGAPPPPPPPGR